MTIQNLSEHILLITLPAEPQLGKEMEMVIRSAESSLDYDVIVDFSLAETLPSATLGNLLVLDRLLSTMGRQLILCSVPSNINSIFTQVGLHKLFRFADDEFAALQAFDRSMCLGP